MSNTFFGSIQLTSFNDVVREPSLFSQLSGSTTFVISTETSPDNSLVITQPSGSSNTHLSADATRFYISGSGNVGINTNAPRGQFDVNGASVADEFFCVDETSGRQISIGQGMIRFFEDASANFENPNAGVYDNDKEKARLRSAPGSHNVTLEISGSGGYTSSLYISESGQIGFNTADPQSEFDAVVNKAQFQTKGKRKGLKINEEGNIESFNKDADSAATGSEFVLRYSRGSSITADGINTLFGGGTAADDAAALAFFNAKKSEEQNSILEKLEGLGFINLPQVGDTIGSIRFIAESGSTSGFDDRATGEAAAITATVHSADASGVRGDLIFKVADQTGAAIQRMVLDSGDAHELSGSLTLSGPNEGSAFLRLHGTTANSLAFIGRYGGSTADKKIGRALLYDDGTQKIRLSAKGYSFITATSDGNSSNTRLGIGTDSPRYDTMLDITGNTHVGGVLVVTGSITSNSDISTTGTLEARVKSFVIPHPTQEGKQLRYGVLEGPEHAVYYRGKTTSNTIELPEEWTGLVDEKSITIQLTPIGSYQKLSVQKILNNTIFIKNNNLIFKKINAFFTVHGTRKDVSPLEKIK